MRAILIASCLLGIILFAGMQSAHGATLWDFVISAGFEQDRIGMYERPTISGTVFDHAMKPVANATVTVRFADTTAITVTNATGNFEYTFGEAKMPGMFTANIHVTSGDLRGMSKATLRVGEEIITFNELYYKSADIPQNADNPYKALQLKHYQEYLSMQEKRLQRQLEIEMHKQDISEKRMVADKMLLDAIEAETPGYGTFSGYRYDQYIKGLNPGVKDVITSQINYTKNLLEEARHAMKEVLDNGGSLQEARSAYFEKLSTPKHEIEQFVANATGKNVSEIKSDAKKINSKNVKGLSVTGKK